MEVVMKPVKILLSSAMILFLAAASAWLHAREQGPPAAASAERAQDQRPTTPDSPFSTLPGFRVDRVNPVAKTDSYIVITFDSRGRPVVGQSVSGSGSHPRILLDEDRDGTYEGEKIVSDRLNTCHGLFFDGPTTLYADCFGRLDSDPPAPPAPPAPVGAPGPGGGGGGGGRGGGPNAAGTPGLYKLQDTNGDDVMDTIERITRYSSNGMGDHGPHAIRRGPDGSITLLIGNNTYVGSSPVTDSGIDTSASPNWNNLEERQFLPAYPDPRFGNSARIGVHSLIARLQPDGRFAVLFSGMRNPYDFAYNLAGEAFVFDSDMEWDVNSPWYREVRTFHAVPGGDGGYRNGTGKYQDEYFDAIPALRHLRRGSPVGVETYQSYAYPSRFFDNLFEADWSRGRLLYTALTPNGATYRGREDLAEFIHGEPMPITDLETGPDGNIHFTTGGAAANGGLYKVTWTGERPPQPDMSGIFAVVRQSQPLSSWGWANIERVKSTMGAASFGAELEKVARNAGGTSADRARALLEMQRHGVPPSGALLQALLKDRDAGVRAAVVFVAGVQQSNDAKAVAAAGLRDADPVVQRRAAEALVRLGLRPEQPSFAPIADIYALLGSPDRFVRYAARIALEHTPRDQWAPRVLAETNVVAATEGLLALSNTKTSEADLAAIFNRLLVFMRRTNLPTDQKIRVLRTFQVAATETDNSVSAEIKKQVHDALIGQFPARESASAADTYLACSGRAPETTPAGCEQTMYAHHMAKVLAYTGEPDVIDKVLAIMPKGDTDQPGQIDYMYALRVVDHGWTPPQKQQMIAWFAKATRWRGGSTFSGHVNQIFDAAIDVLTAEEKQMAYKAAPLFAPLSADELAAAAAGRGGRGGGGGPPPPGVAPGAPAAPGPAAAAPVAAARGGGGGGGGGRGGSNVPANARQTRLDTQERYDNLVFPRGGGPGVLAGRAGGPPNPVVGAQVFQEQCASCHRFGATGATYGPDLSSIGKTMLRRDILRAVFFPDEKVDPKYRTTVITTREKATIRGLVVSENAQAVVLKTAEAAEPVTVQKAQVASRTTDNDSIMPTDLPDTAGDQSIAHVVAYLMAGPGQ
jgi:putative heme-binding domain-containing protein